MNEACLLARQGVLTVDGLYSARFAKPLASEGKQAKKCAARREGNEASRLENKLALPIPSVFAGAASASRVFTRLQGRIAGPFAA